MHDARAVGSREAGGQLQQDRSHVGNRDRAPLDPLLERLALVERHGDEELLLPVADLVNSGNVWMIEGARGLRLSEEARLRVRILRDRGREELEGDLSVQAGIFGEIDDAHPADAKRPEDAIVGDVGSNHLGLADSGKRSAGPRDGV